MNSAVVLAGGVISNLMADFGQKIFSKDTPSQQQRLLVFFMVFLLFTWFVLVPRTIKR